MQKTTFVNDPEVAARLLFGEPFAYHGSTQSIGDANAGRTCSEHDDLLVLQAFSGHFDRAQNGSQSNSRRPLDVVVERQQFIVIALEDRPGVRGREVLPLQACSRKLLLHRLNELIDEVKVRLTGNPFVPPAEVLRIG